MFRRQQRTQRRRTLLRLRDRQLAVLQQMQHVLQLRLGQRVQHGLTVILADIIAHRLTVIPLGQQFAELGENLPMVVVLPTPFTPTIRMTYGVFPLTSSG